MQGKGWNSLLMLKLESHQRESNANRKQMRTSIPKNAFEIWTSIQDFQDVTSIDIKIIPAEGIWVQTSLVLVLLAAIATAFTVHEAYWRPNNLEQKCFYKILQFVAD